LIDRPQDVGADALAERKPAPWKEAGERARGGGGRGAHGPEKRLRCGRGRRGGRRGGAARGGASGTARRTGRALRWWQAGRRGGVGGNGRRAKVAGRSGVRRSACGAGAIPRPSSWARMNRSTGVQGHDTSWTAGNSGRVTGRKAQWEALLASPGRGVDPAD